MRPSRSVFALALLAVTGCRNTPSDLREWRPSDHTHQEGAGAPPTAQQPAEDSDSMIAALGLYRVQCASCHGARGRGDGPQAAMVRPPDFANAAFQSGRTDEQLREVITRGRGAMPGFGQSLRPEAIELLVRLVREMGRTPPG
jgi:mono/diheme cytochrome c family protein